MIAAEIAKGQTIAYRRAPGARRQAIEVVSVEQVSERTVYAEGYRARVGDGVSTVERCSVLLPSATPVEILAGECAECGEDLHPGAPCRTPAEILAECAPPADYAARFRAERAASIARADANRPGATPAAERTPVYAVGDCRIGDCRRPVDHKGRHGEPTPAEDRAAAERARSVVTRREQVDIFADAPWYDAATGEVAPLTDAERAEIAAARPN